jgi:hypothetical protein
MSLAWWGMNECSSCIKRQGEMQEPTEDWLSSTDYGTTDHRTTGSL